MARLQIIRFLQTTLANLETQAAANNLKVGEPYLVTDLGRLAYATEINAFELVGIENGTVSGLTSLTIDCANNTHFMISISANETFSLSNVEEGIEKVFFVKNTSAGSIIVTVPNTAFDIKTYISRTLLPNFYVEVSVIKIGTLYFWQLSEPMG
ncbi:MAG: hypothetical protein M9949_04635 [Candidatus Kapabacteria bacterium]|nr:hypothetical protein [Candidatus Kapabacteria bacterium]